MLDELRRLGRETAVYGLSTVVGRLLNFLLLPLYTHLLAPGEYGIVATIYAYIAFLNIAYQAGLDQAYLRFAGEGDRSERFSSAVALTGALSLGLSALLVAFAGFWAGAGGLPSGGAGLVRLAAAILALDALAAVPFMELRRAHRPWYYVGVKTAGIALNVALNVVLLWKFRMGVTGVLLASAAASALSLLLLAPVTASLLRPGLSRASLAELARFGFPYIPAGLASMAVQVIDRPLLLALTDSATVGLYQANVRLGVVMAMAVNMFDAAWRPFFLERACAPGSRELFGRVLTYVLAAASALALAVGLFLPELVRVPLAGRPLIHPEYWPGLGVVPVVLAGYVFHAAYVNFMVQVMIPKRSDLLATAALLGAGVTVGGILTLVPAFGMMGAAVAGLLAHAAMALCLYSQGQRLYPVPYEAGRLAHLLFALTAVGAFLFAVDAAQPSPAAWALARAAAVAGLPGILWATGFFLPDEAAALRGVLSRAPSATARSRP